MRCCFCLALLVLAIPAAASGDPATFEVPAKQTNEFSLRATHGYRIDVSTEIPFEAPRSHGPGYVWITARKGTTQVVYLVRSLAKRPGVVRARLAGVGRIAVHFRTLKTGRRTLPSGCEGPREAVLRGVFQGRIVIHGEQGYTKLDRRSASGTIVRSFKQTCPDGRFARELREKLRKAGLEGGARMQLYAGPVTIAGQFVNFLATRIRFRGRPVNFFLAYALGLRHGVTTFRTVGVTGKGLLVPHPWGVLRDATVTPHGAFTGSAAFHLESPTSASWEGDLQVELPGLAAPLALTGPGWRAKLCEGSRCAPKNGTRRRAASSLTMAPFFRRLARTWR